jgi:pimeloyl-ACP methyl ester carboxylesterase
MKTWPRRISIALLLLGSMSLVACHHHQQPLTVQPGQSFYVRQAGYRTVIVFVHGIFGDGTTTWTNPSNKAYWPELIKQDDKDQWFRKSDIFVYSYDSPFLRQSYTIGQIAENMDDVFNHYQIFQSHDEVVFICHSMGGLVVKEYLQENQVEAGKVSLIYFYATPTDGSSLANLASLISRNPELAGLRPANTNEDLLDLQRRWSRMPTKITSRCAYEVLGVKNLVKIVDEVSARSGCEHPVALSADHISIVKPPNRGDEIYFTFQDAFDHRQENATVYVAKTTIQAGQRMQCTGAQGQEGMCVPVAPSASAEAAPEPATTAQSQAPTAQPEQPAEVSEVAAKPNGAKPVRSAPKTSANEMQQVPPSLSATNVGASPVPNGVARANRYPSRPAGVSR